MLKALKGISGRGRWNLARWTVFGTLGCIAFAVTFNALLFRRLGEPAYGLSILSATVIPLLLAGPLFFYLTLKLRELAIANHKLDEAASTDSLTQCLNRGAFTALVEAWIAKNAGHTLYRPCALLVVDADRFKAVNDRFGHLAGDEALCHIAAAIREATRADDLVGRLGGEEFAVFLPGVVDMEAIAERIRRNVETTTFEADGETWKLTVSVGGASFDTPVPFSELYRAADTRLFAAKRFGRNRIVLVGTSGETPTSSSLLH